MQPIVFQKSAPLTLGVEIEFQLLDSATLDLSPKAPNLLEDVPENLRLNIKPEFIRSMIEISSPVCQNMTELEQELASLCKLVEDMAAKQDCVLFAASLHPFALLKERHLSPGVRYGKIMNDLQLAGRRVVTQALHVHVGMPDPETTIKVCNCLRTYLPIFLALTTSSPFLEGEDTGFYSYRTNIFKALPRSGIPEKLENWTKFLELLQLLNEATILTGIKELWWDVRPHPDFGTIEIRICDLPSRFDEILGVAALIQATVAHIIKDPPHKEPFREIMLHNKWHASRYGLQGIYIGSKPWSHTSFSQAASNLYDLIANSAKVLGGLPYLHVIKRILAEGTSAHKQRELYAKEGDFKTMIDKLRSSFWK